MVLAPLSLPPDVEVAWTAPAECASRDELEDWIAGYLPRATARAFSAEASVTPTPTGYRLELRIDGQGRSSQRSVEADSCRVLAQTCALLVAVHVDALSAEDAVSRVVSAVPQPPARTPPVPAVPPAPPPTGDPTISPRGAAAPRERPAVEPAEPAMPSSSPARTLLGFVAAQLGGSLGLLPQWAAQSALWLGVGARRWRVEGGPSASLWPDVHYPQRPSTSARFALLGGHVRGCPVIPVRERVSVPICVGLRGGALRAKGTRGVETPRVRWTTWAATTVGASITHRPRPRLGIRGGLDLAVAWNRPRYFVGPEPTTRLSFGRVGAEVFAAVEAYFGGRKSSRKSPRPR
ncbi:MAG: hypothetical protein KDK70_17530 [Myxococcales bacterium]|nr:hypothetical protein [Myxococcales bacterium]